jgi:hypothetical protein
MKKSSLVMILALVGSAMGQTIKAPETQTRHIVRPAAFHDCLHQKPEDVEWCKQPMDSPVAEGCTDPLGKGFTCPAIIETSITDQNGSKVVKLTDPEYANLQKLRQAVIDEEKRLAMRYGADVPPLCSSWPKAQPGETCEAMPIGPHYEFHGQFLLIEKAK